METNEILVRQASMADWETIQRIGRQTFSETFAKDNADADMEEYLAESFSEEKLRAEFSNPDSLFYIAWQQDQPIGYLKVNTGNAQTEAQAPQAMEIERIYVLAAYHGKKVGQILYDKALEVAMARRSSYLWLGVWEENARAIRFYEKNGFVAFDKHIFKIGSDEQTDIMMKKTLL
ncbi:GNAT family N-acetyltransferase [Chitinophaga horti]|uniref:GNAT family N-acetyltransferase n=1 Tax=Chitinophaga horti TaxID=2920382 RepID=A0ABY6J7T3_9BACT|nr:GNAT family N-acetyltransferase [Chitinophaga horti]UYQ95698.1 GNAT family N-acetyltransferase [Chitinophaga horti]